MVDLFHTAGASGTLAGQRTAIAAAVALGALALSTIPGLIRAARERPLEARWLAAIAFEKVGLKGLEAVLDGPAAMAFGGEGAIAISKLVVGHAKDVKNLEILGGILDGEVLDGEGIERISKLPGRKELQAMVLAGFFGPVSEFHASMGNLLTEVHGLIEALENDKSD